MFELLANGPFTITGTLAGIFVATMIHKFVPALSDATYLWAVLIGAGFVIGFAIDFRSERRK